MQPASMQPNPECPGNPQDDEALSIRPKFAAQFVTSAYLCLFTLLHPLVMHNGYYDITEAKFACFAFLSLAYILCIIGVRLIKFLRARRMPDMRGLLHALNAVDLCLLAFCFIFCVSALLSPQPGPSVLGATNRYQGVLTVALYAALFFCISRNPGLHPVNEAALVAGFCCVCLLAVLQAFGLDPFRLRALLTSADRSRYLSTLGNINFYSGYLATLLPLILSQWCFAQGARRYLYAFALLCGAGGALLSGSESFALAFFTMLLLAPAVLCRHPRALRRCCCGVMILFAAMQLLYRFLLVGGRMELSVSFFLRSALQPPIWAALLTVLLLIFLRLPGVSADRLAVAGKRYRLVLLALAIAVILCLLLFNTVFAGRSLGFADRFFRFDADWGTDRGRIWRFCIEQFRQFTPLQKLLGAGPGCLYRLDAARNLFPDASVDSAHNEFLHYLLTTGVAGLGCYLAVLLSTLRSTLRHCAQSPLICGLTLCLVSYLAQSFVNIAQPVSTPYLFLCLGLLRACAKARETRPVQNKSGAEIK